MTKKRQFGVIGLLTLLVCADTLFLAAAPALAQPETSKTAAHVKIHGVADKPNDTGHQIVTISLEINEKYFLIGDKVPEDLAPSQFRVKFLINGKLAEAKITYPRG